MTCTFEIDTSPYNTPENLGESDSDLLTPAIAFRRKYSLLYAGSDSNVQLANITVHAAVT